VNILLMYCTVYSCAVHGVCNATTSDSDDS